jgi:hypothetical protein
MRGQHHLQGPTCERRIGRVPQLKLDVHAGRQCLRSRGPTHLGGQINTLQAVALTGEQHRQRAGATVEIGHLGRRGRQPELQPIHPRFADDVIRQAVVRLVVEARRLRIPEPSDAIAHVLGHHPPRDVRNLCTHGDVCGSMSAVTAEITARARRSGLAGRTRSMVRSTSPLRTVVRVSGVQSVTSVRTRRIPAIRTAADA